MFTRRLKQLVGNAAATVSTSSGDIGSQPVHTKVSPGKAVGKKCVGKAVSEVVAVPVPFGSLPGDFGTQPLLAEEASHKKVANEASNITGGEEQATPAKATGGEVAAAMTVLVGEVAAAPAKVTGGEVAAAPTVSGAEVAAALAKVTGGKVAAVTTMTGGEVAEAPPRQPVEKWQQ